MILCFKGLSHFQVLTKIDDGIPLYSLWTSTFTADSDWHLENMSRCCSFALVVKTSVTENSPSWSFTHSDDSIKASPYKWHAQGILYIVWWLIPFHLLLSNLTQCFKYHSTWFLCYETVVTPQWRSQTSWQKSNYHFRKDKADVDTICPLLDPNFHGFETEPTPYLPS